MEGFASPYYYICIVRFVLKNFGLHPLGACSGELQNSNDLMVDIPNCCLYLQLNRLPNVGRVFPDFACAMPIILRIDRQAIIVPFRQPIGVVLLRRLYCLGLFNSPYSCFKVSPTLSSGSPVWGPLCI